MPPPRLYPSLRISSFCQPSVTLSRRTFTSSSHPAAQHVQIIEVGPRDGLQNEKTSIPLKTKIELIEKLAETGLRTIEAGSFVSPKWVPQMANSSDILGHLLQKPPPAPQSITYQWLLPNMKGLENYFAIQDNAQNTNPNTDNSAYPTPPPSPSTSSPSSYSTTQPNLTHQQPPHEISIFLSATDSFSLANTNCTTAESLTRYAPLITHARKRNTRIRAYISVALGCPFDGPDVPPQKVASLATTLLEMGADEISVADTTGMGTAPRARELLKTLAAAGVRNEDLAMHYHDTYGMALVNTVVALEHGITRFDSAVGGLGGCPYSPGATGNVATEDLVHLMHSLGMETGIDVGMMAEIGGWITGVLGKGNESRAGKAVLARLRREASKGLEEKAV